MYTRHTTTAMAAETNIPRGLTPPVYDGAPLSELLSFRCTYAMAVALRKRAMVQQRDTSELVRELVAIGCLELEIDTSPFAL